MSTLQVVTDRVVKQFAVKKPNQAFDPGTIDTILTLVKDIIATFRDFCGESPSGVVAIANKPSWLQERRLTMKVRREMGWRAFRQHGDDVIDALKETGTTLTADEVEALYNEV